MPLPVDPAMIADLFDRHAAALELYARQWSTAPEDCVQEAFIELARQAAAPENPAGWLFRVVRNKAFNASRAARRRAAREQAAAEQAMARTHRQVDPTKDLALLDLLTKLEPMATEVVILRVWGALAWREIAELVGVSTTSAQRRYVEGLEQLRRHMEPNTCPTN